MATAATTTTTRALCIGVDYPGQQYELRGCVNDAENLREFLLESGAATKPEDVTVLRNGTADAIYRALVLLAATTHREIVPSVFISFSGHGTYMRDTDGDEVDGYDECICPCDYQTAGVLRDDELNDLLSLFHPETRISLLMDCCHSGSCLDLPYRYLRRGDSAEECSAAGCHPNVVMISGCADDQTSADAYDASRTEFTGAMTSSFLDCLKLEPDLLGDAFGLLTCMRVLLSERGMTQVPQLCTSQPASVGCVPFLPVVV
jgi:hypothetical protein